MDFPPLPGILDGTTPFFHNLLRIPLHPRYGLCPSPLFGAAWHGSALTKHGASVARAVSLFRVLLMRLS